MSFWRIAAKMSPSKSCTRSGIRGVNGGQSRSGRPARVSSARSAMPISPGSSITSSPPTPSACTMVRAQVVRRVGGHGEPDHLAAAPPLQRGLELAHQILGLFLDLQVAVAQHPEGAVAEHDVAGEELAQEHLQEALQRQEAGLPLRSFRQPHEARHLGRNRQQSLEHGVVRLALELEPQGEAAVGDEGKGMRRVDGERAQDRKHLLEEMRLHHLEVGAPELARPQDLDSLRPQQPLEFAQRILLAHHQRPRVDVDPPQLVGRRQPVGGGRVHALAHQPAQAGDADRVELVEVRGRDRQEPHPLQQRHARVLGLRHHPPVECQPGELAIDEPLRPRRIEIRQAAARRRCGLQEIRVDRGGLDPGNLEHFRPRPGAPGFRLCVFAPILGQLRRDATAYPRAPAHGAPDCAIRAARPS